MRVNQRVVEWLGLDNDGSSRKAKIVSFAIVALLGVVGAVMAGYWGFLVGLVAGSVLVAAWRWRED